MDSITHTLFGLAIYGAVNKENMTRSEKRVLLGCALVGSQIPDIDVISRLWDTEGRYQMWHRGITHSVFLAPVWAGLISGIARSMVKVRGWFWYWLSFIAVVFHITSDCFNAWGTGILEPFSNMRASIGTIPIVDLTTWLILACGYLFVRFSRERWKSHNVYRFVWLLIGLHMLLQTTQGVMLSNQIADKYDQVTRSAGFVPGQFTVLGKKGDTVDLYSGSVFSGLRKTGTLKSAEQADKQLLFNHNPRAKTLTEWSPFVVLEENNRRIAVYDPRFYMNGASFLTEEYVKTGAQ